MKLPPELPKPKRVRASLDKVYVFPDGTRVKWSDSTFRLCVLPADKEHGLVVQHGSYGGMVAVNSWPKDEHGNPKPGFLAERYAGRKRK